MSTRAPSPPGLLAPRYWLTWVALGMFRLLEPLPYRLQCVLGRGLGRLIHLFPSGFKRIARRNIELCWPDVGASRHEQMVADHFVSLGMALFETAITWWSPARRIVELTQVDGLEHLDAALARGRGVILLSAHFTTLEIGGRAICERRTISLMYRPTKNPVMEHFLQRNRGRHAVRAIPRHDVRTLVTTLKGNGIVWYAPDQSYRNKGAEMVEFFGIPAATNTATSRLARMTGAAVLPYFPERLPDCAGYRMVIQPALEDFPSDDPALDALRFNRLIEAQVRRIPDQYLWIHRRFKGLTAGYPDYYRRANV
jgi:KDO2-lipid IV(A) lauroyltransferase